MAIGDSTAIVRTYLVAQATLAGIGIYSPRLPEGATLPAIGFFVRGGTSTPYIPTMPEPSYQFDCWADTPLQARQVYRLLYDVLQGIQNQAVVIGINTYYIVSAIEEVQGQDVQDVEFPNYHRVIGMFKIMLRV